MKNLNTPRKAKAPPRSGSAAAAKRPRSVQRPAASHLREADLVIVTGMSGSGKGTVLKAFEDLGYYCVDNLPVDLIPKFAGLYRNNQGASRAALLVDVREGASLKRFPAIYRRLRRQTRSTLVFLQASDEALLRRFSETRRPHPLGGNMPLRETIAAERKALQAIRNAAELVIDTSQFNVHDLRNLIFDHFSGAADQHTLLISCVSFGYRYGLHTDSDLIFDVRFLPNPHYIPKFQRLSGKHPAVVKYIRSFPQTQEFTKRISELLAFLIPHYIREGKSYLTIGFGCTGGRHRSVMMAETIAKTLAGRGFRTKVLHRDVGK